MALLFVIVICIGFIINIINQQLEYPYSQAIGWTIVILGIFGFLIEGVLKGRFK